MLLFLALVLGLAAGCKQQVFIAERDLQGLATNLHTLEKDPHDAIAPDLQANATPPDVNDPDRKPRPYTLEELIAIGLEYGYTASRAPGSGTVDDTLPAAQFGSGTLAQQSEYLKVIALNPALAYTAIENQLARYDTQFVTSINYSATDSLQQGLQSFQNGQAASFASSFIKGMPFGGTANVSFLTDYRLLSSPPTGTFGVLNPSYTTKLVLGVDMPLWKDYGVDINQLLNSHPQTSQFYNVPGVGSFSTHVGRLSPFNQAPEGILIARLRYDQQKSEFERQLNILVLNIEVAYWKLYQAYGQLYSFEEVLRIAHKSWMINKAKYDVGTIGPANYYPILGQYQEFRGERLAALANVLDKERTLRRLVGLPLEDGTRIIPITPPSQAQVQPNYDVAVKDSMLYRPELAIARENLRIAHYQLVKEKNNVKPDLRFAAQYVPTGFGTRLDGDALLRDGTGELRPNNALRSLAGTSFNDWTLGLTLNVPLGYRAELANIRAARLSLAQNYYFLKDTEERARSFLVQQYQELSKWYNLIEARRAERKAYAESVEARFKEFAAGKTTVADFLLEAQRRLATSQVKEYEAIAEYNNSLARFEWGKGTILHTNNIYLSEGPLPPCAQVRAVDHERERTKIRVAHNRPRPLETPGQMCGFNDEVRGEPHSVNLTGPGVATAEPPMAQPLPAGPPPHIPVQHVDPLPAPGRNWKRRPSRNQQVRCSTSK